MKIDENKILKNIETGYDQMADKFSSTRNFFWRDLSFIGDYAKAKDKIFDFGCGNGRILEILQDKNIQYWGADVSRKLINLAKTKYPQFKEHFSKIEVEESLPFKENFFNLVFSIAVFHHFPPKYQKKKIKEIYDLLKPDGKIILTAWNLDQDNLIPSKKWETISEKEAYISFQNNKGEKFSRYHYVFSEEDLRNLLEKAGFQVEKCDTISKKNILIIARK